MRTRPPNHHATCNPEQGRMLRRRCRRRGVTSMLAMMFLVLFGALAIGFYGSVNTSVQIAGNEGDARKALLAAESGMSYVQRLISKVSIRRGTPENQIWGQVVPQVLAQVEGKDVLRSGSVEQGPQYLGLDDLLLPDGFRFSAR